MNTKTKTNKCYTRTIENQSFDLSFNLISNLVFKLIFGLSFIIGLAACGLNSSDDKTIVANLRGSSFGGSTAALTNGGKAIDLQTNRPANTSLKWTYMSVPKLNLERFLSINEGTAVTIDNNNYSYVESFFWGDFRTTGGATLQIGNQASEQAYFESIDKSKFQFELTIWDYFTDGLNAQGERYDYLGYAYFGKGLSSVQAGELSKVVYVPNASGAQIGLRFTDSIGDIVIEANLNRSTRTMTGNMFYRVTGSSLVLLGQFNNLKVCEFFKCS